MKVPFLDLDAQYQSIKSEVHEAIDSVLTKKDFIQGKRCENFSRHFCEVHGGNFAVGCSNGTSAITMSLKALGVGPGDEVITVANTFFATVEAIHEVGADIVLVDCRPDTYGMDVDQIEGKITQKTKAIIPVHLYGNAVEMDRVIEIANKYNLKVVEDCAQAHMSEYDGTAVAAWGDAGTFSFYPGKNLGAYGDAGLVVAKEEETLKVATMNINHGRTKKYEHDFLAGNYRMDGIQAAILDVKLKYLPEWTERRIAVAKCYDARFEKEGFKVIKTLPKGKCVYHLYVVEVSNRDEVMSYLNENQIDTGIHYPVPMHLQPALEHLGYKKGDFPVSEKTSERIVSLPIFSEISEEQVEFVIEKFLEVAKK